MCAALGEETPGQEHWGGVLESYPEQDSTVAKVNTGLYRQQPEHSADQSCAQT